MVWKQTKEQKDIETLVSAHARMGTFNGVVLVVKENKVLYQKAYGSASFELSVPLTTKHLFNIGSVSKTFTAFAILQLEVQGRLNVQDVLSNYVPEFPDCETITLHHLLSNTSGIPDYLMLESYKGWYALPHMPVELLEYIRNEPRLFAPGQGFGYSNSNWVLLVMAIEKITSKPWAQALRDLVLQPFGLEHTVIGEADKVIPDRASGYRLEDSELVTSLHINPTVEVGAGGIFSNANDVLKLEYALLQSPLYKRMVQPVGDSLGITYGYGLMSAKRFGRTWQGHSGGTFGFSSFLTHYSSEDVTIIVLSNIENGSAMQLEQDLAAVIFAEPYTLPGARAFVQVAPEILDRYVGTYRTEFMGRPMNFEVKHENDTLMVLFPLLPKAKLKALSETRFVGNLKGGEVIFSFKTDRVMMDWSGMIMESPRVD